MDGGPAVEMYSDVYSTSGSSWYSMKKKNSQNYNWRISATLMTADMDVVKPLSANITAASTTYNVYRDGEMIASGVTFTKYTVANAVSGNYYVTAVSDESESAASNSIVYSDPSGIEDIEANATVKYDNASQTILLGKEGDCNVYAVNGILVKSAASVSSLEVSDLANGVYIATVTIDGATTTIKITK